MGIINTFVNTVRLVHNDGHCAGDVFRWIFLKENACILYVIKFLPKVPIGDKSVFSSCNSLVTMYINLWVKCLWQASGWTKEHRDINSLWPSNAMWYHRTRRTVVMAFRLLNALPLPQPMPIYCQLDPQGNLHWRFNQNIMMFITEYTFENAVCKRNCGHFVELVAGKHNRVGLSVTKCIINYTYMYTWSPLCRQTLNTNLRVSN